MNVTKSHLWPRDLEIRPLEGRRFERCGKPALPPWAVAKDQECYNGKVSKKDRETVYRRDNGVCSYCFRKVEFSQCDIDHVTPCHQIPTEDGIQMPRLVGLFGSEESPIAESLPSYQHWEWFNSPDNYVLACIRCNQNKGGLTLLEAFIHKKVFGQAGRRVERRQRLSRNEIYRLTAGEKERETLEAELRTIRQSLYEVALSMFDKSGGFCRQAARDAKLLELRVQYKNSPELFTADTLLLLRGVLPSQIQEARRIEKLSLCKWCKRTSIVCCAKSHHRYCRYHAPDSFLGDDGGRWRTPTLSRRQREWCKEKGIDAKEYWRLRDEGPFSQELCDTIGPFSRRRKKT